MTLLARQPADYDPLLGILPHRQPANFVRTRRRRKRRVKPSRPGRYDIIEVEVYEEVEVEVDYDGDVDEPVKDTKDKDVTWPKNDLDVRSNHELPPVPLSDDSQYSDPGQTTDSSRRDDSPRSNRRGSVSERSAASPMLNRGMRQEEDGLEGSDDGRRPAKRRVQKEKELEFDSSHKTTNTVPMGDSDDDEVIEEDAKKKQQAEDNKRVNKVKEHEPRSYPGSPTSDSNANNDSSPTKPLTKKEKKKKKRKSKRKSSREKSPPRTEKPTAKPRFSGSDLGLGRSSTGRKLTPEEAKEVKLPPVIVKPQPSFFRSTPSGNQNNAPKRINHQARAGAKRTIKKLIKKLVQKKVWIEGSDSEYESETDTEWEREMDRQEAEWFAVQEGIAREEAARQLEEERLERARIEEQQRRAERREQARMEKERRFQEEARRLRRQQEKEEERVRRSQEKEEEPARMEKERQERKEKQHKAEEKKEPPKNAEERKAEEIKQQQEKLAKLQERKERRRSSMAVEKERRQKFEQKRTEKKERRRSSIATESKEKEQFQGSKFDLSRAKVYFMVGDQVPMEMICPSGTTIYGFKEEILKMKDSGSSIVSRYFDGIDDPARLKIFAAGSYGEGDPLPDDILVPRDSSPYSMFTVLK